MSGIPVFLASDDKYAPFVATTMASILSNTKSFINFYILDDNITDKNKRKIKKISRIFKNFSIEYIQVDTERHFESLPSLPYISKSMYSRIMIPILKPDLGKIIYSDIDVAFTDDIKKLYETDIENHTIGAVPMYRKSKTEVAAAVRLDINIDHLFMSGLLIIDIKKWNDNNDTKKILKLAKVLAQDKKLLLPDQDTLNKFFDGDFFRIDNTWCVIHKNLQISVLDPEEIKGIVDNQKIAHFAGGDRYKPWNNKGIEGSEYFWKYVPYTAFKRDIERINREFNKPVKPVRPKHYRRKYLNMIIKLIVSKRKYRKLKRDPALFFGDSKNAFIKFLGRLYL